MSMDLRLGDSLEVLKTIPDSSIDLVISDPPYFKVINESWDYLWRTEDDYLKWSELWIAEISRVLRVGGSIYVFGYFRMLSKLLPILNDHGLELRQQIVIDKGMQAVAGRATRQYKIFPNVTESVLFLYKDNKSFAKQFLKQRQKDLGLSSTDINKALGVKTNGGGMWSIYTGDNVCKQFPTEDSWNRLQQILKFDIPYNQVSQTFNPIIGITDVWDDIDFYADTHRIHPTQKPTKLVERMVLASSNSGDVILDPFMGGGTTGVVCKQINREFIGIEIDQQYFELAKQRIESSVHQIPLFNM